MTEKKFNPKKLKKLNDPARLTDIPPALIQQRLNLKNPKVMVDIGAGTAFFSRAFLSQFSCSTIYACDLSEVMLDWIREHVTPDHPGIIPVKSGESTLPIEDGTADLVFMIALHHELENPLQMLKEALRLLKPGGKILIIDWLKKEMDQGPALKIRCTPQEVTEQLVQTGFSDTRIHDDLPKHFMVTGQKSL